MEQSTNGVTLINGLLDFILLNVRFNADKLKNYQVVPVPDLQKKVQFNLLVTSLTASLTASQGTLSDFTTIKRVGDVTLTSQGNTLYVTAPIALEYLELAFRHYTLQVAMIKKSGDKLNLNVKKTFFNAFLVIKFNGLDCEIFFEKFTMLQFNAIDVDISGFSFLNPIARKIADWLVDFFNNFIMKEVAEEYTRNLLNMGLSDKRSLHRLFGYAVNGVVLSSTNDSTECGGSVDLDDLQISRSNDVHPIAPVRQRRSTSNYANERRNNQNNTYDSSTYEQDCTVPPAAQVPRPNNVQPQHTEPRSPMNGSAGSRLPEGRLTNDLTGRRNEIFIQPNKLFSTKSSGRVEVDYIPIKPPML